MTADDRPGRDDADQDTVRRQWPITRDLDVLRDRVQRHAEEAGLSEHRAGDLLLAVNEAAINVLEHACAPGTVAIWHDADSVTVDITDTAGRLSTKHIPRDRPHVAAARGYGLWLMQTLCDELIIHQYADHSLVRLRMSLRPVPQQDGPSPSPRREDPVPEA
jgi:anti-sigma regulatory factor (Ser/Thr protein kinase)